MLLSLHKNPFLSSPPVIGELVEFVRKSTPSTTYGRLAGFRGIAYSPLLISFAKGDRGLISLFLLLKVRSFKDYLKRGCHSNLYMFGTRNCMIQFTRRVPKPLLSITSFANPNANNPNPNLLGWGSSRDVW